MPRERPNEPPKDLLLIPVQDAVGPSRCPVCTIIARQADRHHWHLLWESVNDPGTRATLVASQGFCAEHAWHIAGVERANWGSGLGLAIIYEHLVRELIAAADAQLRTPAAHLGSHRELSAAGLLDALSPRSPCPSCQLAVQTAWTHAEMVAKLCAYPAFADRYARSAGLCFNHLQMAIEATADRRAAHDLLLDARRRLSRAPPDDLAAVGGWLIGAPLTAGSRSRADRWSSRSIVVCPLCQRRLAGEQRHLHDLFSASLGSLEPTDPPGRPVVPRWCSAHLRWLAADDGIPDERRKQVVRALHGALGAGLDCLVTASRRDLASDGWVGVCRAAIADWALDWYAELASEQASRFHRHRHAVTRTVGIARCPACTLLDADERLAARELVSAWHTATEPDGLGGALCLPHLRSVLAEMPSDGLPRGLMVAWRTALESLTGELREHIRKHDYRYQSEPRGAEQTSWLRALALVSGVDPVAPSCARAMVSDRG